MWQLYKLIFYNYVLSKVECDPNYANNLYSVWKKDRTIMLTAIKRWYEAFIYADDELKNDLKFVISATEIKSEVFKYVKKSLRDDKEFVLSVVTAVPSTFRYINKQLRNDREFILELVKKNGAVLGFVDNYDYVNDKEIALAAITTYPDIFVDLDVHLRGDIDIVYPAIKGLSGSFTFIKSPAIHDKNILLYVVQHIDRWSWTRFERLIDNVSYWRKWYIYFNESYPVATKIFDSTMKLYFIAYPGDFITYKNYIQAVKYGNLITHGWNNIAADMRIIYING